MNTTSNSFSWHRLCMVASYYWPTVRWVVYIIPSLSILSGLFLLLMYYSHAPQVGSLGTNFLTYLVGLTPLILLLERKRSYQMSLMLPAANAEKAAFLLLFFCVLTPLMGALPQLLITSHVSLTDIAMMALRGNEIDSEAAEQTATMISSLTQNPALWMMSYISWVAYAVTCLWVMVKARTNVLLKAIFAPIGLGLGTGFLMGVGVALSSFAIGIKAGMTGDADAAMSTVIPMITNVVKIACTIMIILLCAYVGVAAVMVWRAVARRQY